MVLRVDGRSNEETSQNASYPFLTGHFLFCWEQDHFDKGKTSMSGYAGAGANWCMVKILWHRRETRRQTEKTNLNLKHRKKPVYSTHLNLVRFAHPAIGGECWNIWSTGIMCLDEFLRSKEADSLFRPSIPVFHHSILPGGS